MTSIRSQLVHLHPDFQRPLEEVLEAWNAAQRSWTFIGLRPRREEEGALLKPGSISNDKACRIADKIRKGAGLTTTQTIIVFTEKRVYAPGYYQLFVGGCGADEPPHRVGILSLDFLRKVYRAKAGAPILFGAILSNILYSLGTEVGLKDHGNETRGCIMDLCLFMPDIELGLKDGPRFCPDCVRALRKRGLDDLRLVAEVARASRHHVAADEAVTESIVLRGERAKLDRNFDYNVALSYAGADREYAEQLAKALRRGRLKVFYDRFDQGALWGTNLHVHLTELYRLRAKCCVVFLSKSYGRTGYTRVELDAALARELKEGAGYVLPIRLDDSEVAGILPTRAYLKWDIGPITALDVQDLFKLEHERIRTANLFLEVYRCLHALVPNSHPEHEALSRAATEQFSHMPIGDDRLGGD